MLDDLPEGITFEQTYLLAIIAELRGIRLELGRLSKPPKIPVEGDAMAKKKKPIQLQMTHKNGAKGNKKKAVR